MILWRLMKARYAPGLDGVGARRIGGRWNPPGRGMVYCASNLSLAVLESFVHLPAPLRSAEKFPPMVAVRLTLPQNAEIAQCPLQDPLEADLATTQGCGADWLNAAETLAMSVPSYVVGLEQNILLNPDHPQISEVSHEVLPFAYDQRMGS